AAAPRPDRQPWLRWLVQDLIEAEVRAQIGAGRYERSAGRTAQRHGYPTRPWETRKGGDAWGEGRRGARCAAIVRVGSPPSKVSSFLLLCRQVVRGPDWERQVCRPCVERCGFGRHNEDDRRPCRGGLVAVAIRVIAGATDGMGACVGAT